MIGTESQKTEELKEKVMESQILLFLRQVISKVHKQREIQSLGQEQTL
jgi:hypothetical protein